MTTRGKTCFVIMPFGKKEQVDGTVIDFDAVYKQLIQPAVGSLQMKCVRSDKIDKGGWIHKTMLQHVYDADVAVVDLTTLNPNVFYELGVRHALVPCVTVLIRRDGTRLPFNIEGMNAIPYGNIKVKKQCEEAKERIKTFIRNGLAHFEEDSLVHEILDIRIATEPTVIPTTEVHNYAIDGAPDRHVALITGHLRNVMAADVWVNSENTNMQMARPYERSISSLIRYLGAEKDNLGEVAKDIIAEELTREMGGRPSVRPGVTLVTGPGDLERTNNVKKVFHAASVVGQVGRGYMPIADIGSCVTSALECMDSKRLRDMDLHSILFPLMGTGAGGGARESKAKELIDAAITYLRAHPESRVWTAFFLVWSLEELETCRRILRNTAGVKAVQRARQSQPT